MITQPANPVIVDAFIVEFNAALQSALPWLNNPLGKIQPITKEGRITPAMHLDTGEYIEVFPSDTYCNFSWFDLDKEEPIGKVKFRVPCRFNMFLNLRAIYPTVTASRNLENAKADVFLALKNMSISAGSIRITNISEAYSDVYIGYALPELQDKYFMQPYAGLSFSLDLYVLNTNLICGLQPIPEPVGFRSTDIPDADYVPVEGDIIRL